MRRVIWFCFCLFFPTLIWGKDIQWNFPINRTHAGILLGNGSQGLMIWGDSTLNITFANNGFWDRRGGIDLTSKINFTQFKSLLETKEESKIREIFSTPVRDKSPSRPQQLGGGVLQFGLPKGYTLKKAILKTADARILIYVSYGQGKMEVLSIEQSITQDVTFISGSERLLPMLRVRLLPFYLFNKNKLESIGISVPSTWKTQNLEGFTQELPNDPSFSAGYIRSKEVIILASHVSSTSKEKVFSTLSSMNWKVKLAEKNTWWKQYWSEVTSAHLPDSILQETFVYGLYKQGCSTTPQGIACTLQGPFMEEYQIAPWSNDYHLNINAQMIYTPSLATNRPAHMKPFLDWLVTVLPQFKRYGSFFFESPEAILIPHAVDDQGKIIGNFWTGTLDHATTAWIAFLSYQYFQYTGDSSYLASLTLPLSIGAFEGFWKMLEKNEQGKFVLNFSVSPEYGSGLQGIGKNASFQLAALHRVVSVLKEISVHQKLPQDPRWHELARSLPHYSLIQEPYGENTNEIVPPRIALWEGKDLSVSHRHHSHLAGIYPFQTIHPAQTEHTDVIKNSYWRWVVGGAGGWTGWCIPWASILHNRAGNTDAAISWLHYWNRNFVNEGRGTLHNSTNTGMSMFNEPNWSKEIANGKKNHETMQLDAGFGFLSAVLDLMVSEQWNGVHILPNRSSKWRDLTFQRVRTSGGFLISAKVKENVLQRIDIESIFGGDLILHHNMGNKILVNGKDYQGKSLTLKMKKNEKIILTTP